jgi:hypothetical protein
MQRTRASAGAHGRLALRLRLSDLHFVPFIHCFLDYVACEDIKSFARVFWCETLQFGHIFVQR